MQLYKAVDNKGGVPKPKLGSEVGGIMSSDSGVAEEIDLGLETGGSQQMSH